MAKLTKTQKRELAEKKRLERFNALPLMPDNIIVGEDDLWRFPNGELVPDGSYRTKDGGLVLYEGNFEAGNVLIPE